MMSQKWIATDGTASSVVCGRQDDDSGEAAEVKIFFAFLIVCVFGWDFRAGCGVAEGPFILCFWVV